MWLFRPRRRRQEVLPVDVHLNLDVDLTQEWVYQLGQGQVVIWTGYPNSWAMPGVEHPPLMTVTLHPRGQ
jgi:hypothetical protein